MLVIIFLQKQKPQQLLNVIDEALFSLAPTPTTF